MPRKKTKKLEPGDIEPAQVAVNPIKVPDLPRGAKVAVVHSLRDMEVSLNNIATSLGIPIRTIRDYLKNAVEPQWAEFAESIRDAVTVKEEEIATQALALLSSKMPEAKFPELVGLYKIMRELQGRGMGQAPVLPPPQGAQVSFHVHQNEKIINIVREAEGKVEQELREQIAGKSHNPPPPAAEEPKPES